MIYFRPPRRHRKQCRPYISYFAGALSKGFITLINTLRKSIFIVVPQRCLKEAFDIYGFSIHARQCADDGRTAVAELI